MRIAQITDMHVKRQGEMLTPGLDSYAALGAALRRIDGLDPRPDLMVATGDLTADGKPEEYAALRDLLSGLDMPCLLLPGNHDNRENLRDAFPDQPWEDGQFLLYAVDDWPVRIVALDSVVAGKPHGEICAGRCRWLDKTLSGQPDKPTIVMFHHPPFVTGIAYMDAMGLADPSGLAEVIGRHKQVIRVLCGHIHRPMLKTMPDGTIYANSGDWVENGTALVEHFDGTLELLDLTEIRRRLQAAKEFDPSQLADPIRQEEGKSTDLQ
jgi:Icc protein